MQICPTDLSFAFGTFWDIFSEYFSLQLNFWMPNPWICFRKGDLFQGPRVGSCLTLRNELSEETQKARDFIRKWPLGREQQGTGTLENCYAM